MPISSTVSATAVSEDELWGAWSTTIFATANEYRVQLTNGKIVRFLNSDRNLINDNYNNKFNGGDVLVNADDDGAGGSTSVLLAIIKTQTAASVQAATVIL